MNGSVSQGTIGGIGYYEMNKVPVLGAGTDFVAIADGYLASFITDAGDPGLLEIPAGNWNFETYFSASSGGGSPSFYIELYKVNSGGTATLIASNSATPELISFGTSISPYFSPLAVPTTVLTVTDRLAVRYYVARSGRTITLHTENSHLCQIITTFTTGLTALNGLTAQVQNFATGTSGTDFNISSTSATHTFNLPDASASNRGAVTTGAQTIAGNKTTTSNINVNGVYVGRGASGGDLFAGIAGNTSVGSSALISITTGFPNTALGSEALRNITTGANNIAIGSEAGKIDSGSSTANATSSSSIYIGDNTKPQTNGNTNEIVIGHAASGNGSNSVTIGNSSTTLNKFFGTTLSDAFRLPSDGGGNQITIIENIGTIHEGTASINKIGFNNSNNIYFGKGLSDGGVLTWSNSEVRSYTLPNVSGIIALTTNLTDFVTLSTVQTITAQKTFSNSGAGIGVEVTNSGSGDGLKITHSAGRAFNIQSSGAGFGVIINNETASTSAPFTIQKQGTTKVAFTDAGAADFSSSVTASSFVKSSGTSSQFLKADGSVDSSTYLTTGTAASTYLPLAGGTLTGALNGTSASFTGDITLSAGGTNKVIQYTNTYGSTIVTNALNDNSYITGALRGEALLLSGTASKGLRIGNTTDNISYLSFTSTGAATFSSSVTIEGSGSQIRSGNELRFWRADNAIYTKMFDAGSTAPNGFTFDNLNAEGFHFKNNGTTIMRMNSSGNVGIGTASPAQSLEVKGSSAGVIRLSSTSFAYNIFTSESDGAFYIRDVNNTSNRLTISSTGNVGIGTASPSNKLVVEGYGTANSIMTQPVATFVGGNGWNLGSDGTNALIGVTNSGTDMVFLKRVAGVYSDAMRITSGGNVGINCTPNHQLEVQLPSGSNGQIIRMSRSAGAYGWGIGIDGANSNFNFYNNGGTSVANINNSTGAYTATSDERLKENIEDSTSAIDKLLDIKVRKYDWKDSEIKEDYGFVAQELFEVLPQYVLEGNEENYWGVAKAELVPFLVKAIQELKAEIEALKSQING